MVKIILETPRLVLKEFNLEDAAFILELVNTDDWLNFIGDRKVANLEDAQNFISHKLRPSYAQKGFGLWAVYLKEENQAIGMCGLVNRDSLDDIDIGFALLPKFYKKGYALEAAQATMNFAHEQLQISRIIGITNSDNSNSILLLNKLGLYYEKTIELSPLDKVQVYSPNK